MLETSCDEIEIDVAVETGKERQMVVLVVVMEENRENDEDDEHDKNI